jgi:rhodanese-related sulfurtransferase
MISTFLLAACSGSKKEPVEVLESETMAPVALAAAEFRDQVNSNHELVLIDVRTVEETAEGIIPGAQVIDFKAPDFADRMATLDKEADYYLYCKSGARSSKAAEAMVGMGFKHLYTLEGGLQAWTADGYEVQLPE